MRKIIIVFGFSAATMLLTTANIATAQTWNIGAIDSAAVIASLHDSVLTISGTGQMQNWTWSSSLWYTKIASVVISEGVTTVGNYAFYGCENLTSVIMPTSLDSICTCAFLGCQRLTSITIPSNVMTIGMKAFSDCRGLTSITIPSKVITIDKEAFSFCMGLATVINLNPIPQSISDDAFRGVKLANLTLYVPDCATYGNADGWKEFGATKNIYDSTTCLFTWNIGTPTASNITATFNSDSNSLVISGTGKMQRFAYNTTPWYAKRKRIETVIISEGIFNIGSWAFYDCANLSSATIPNSITSIDTAAFRGCYKLGSITIPSNISTIRDDAFMWSGLKVVTNLRTTPQNISIANEVFYGVNIDKATLYVPDCDSYTNHQHWSDFGIIKKTDGTMCPLRTWNWNISSTLANVTALLNLTDSTLTISGTGEMRGFGSIVPPPWDSKSSRIKTVVINNGVTSIGQMIGTQGAFECCLNLTSVTIPNSIRLIGTYTFGDCQSLTSITIPNSVTNIAQGAFEKCRNLKTITISNKIKSIENETFYGCEKLISLNIPNSVTNIGVSAFSDCKALTSINVPASVIDIGNDAFYNCINLSSITINNGVKSIGKMAFANCSALKSVEIPASIISIVEDAFISSGLMDINVNAANTHYHSFEGILAKKDTLIFCPRYKTGKVTIPNDISFISARSFQNCFKISSVTLPASIMNIGDEAFSGCDLLTSIINHNLTPQSIKTNVFYGGSYFYPWNIANDTLYVPANSLQAYKASAVWKDFGKIFIINPLDVVYEQSLALLRVYPNPTNDKIIIEGNFPQDATIEVYDLYGKQMVKSKLSNCKSFNVSTLLKGVYVLKIGKFRGKFVKE